MIQWGGSDYSMNIGKAGERGSPEIQAAERKVFETALKMGVPRALKSTLWMQRNPTLIWGFVISASAPIFQSFSIGGKHTVTVFGKHLKGNTIWTFRCDYCTNEIAAF